MTALPPYFDEHAKPVTFKLSAGGPPALVGAWLFGIVCDRSPVATVDHEIKVAIVRFDSGADHIKLQWALTLRSGERRVHQEAHVAMPGGADPMAHRRTARFVRTLNDPHALAYRRRPGAGSSQKPGINYSLTIRPVYTPGGSVDELAQAQAALASLRTIKADHDAVLAALASIVKAGGKPTGEGVIFS